MANAREGLLVFSHGAPCVVPWGFLHYLMRLLAFFHGGSSVLSRQSLVSSLIQPCNGLGICMNAFIRN